MCGVVLILLHLDCPFGQSFTAVFEREDDGLNPTSSGLSIRTGVKFSFGKNPLKVLILLHLDCPFGRGMRIWNCIAKRVLILLHLDCPFGQFRLTYEK